MIEIINDVIINNTKINLIRPLEIEITETDESPDYKYITTNEEFRIFGIGDTKDEAIDNLKDHFDFIYKEYGVCDDDKLEKLALEYKKEILEIIGAGEGTIWIVPVRDISYENAKNEIIEYRNGYDHYNGSISELVDALWIDIELIMQIVEDIDREYQFRWY